MAGQATVHGVEVCMSAGLYVPLIRIQDFEGKGQLCDYGSRAALDAGLVNPKHWAHAVYRTLARICEQYQEELQGGTMAAYEETRGGRAEAERARRHGFGD